MARLDLEQKSIVIIRVVSSDQVVNLEVDGVWTPKLLY